MKLGTPVKLNSQFYYAVNNAQTQYGTYKDYLFSGSEIGGTPSLAVPHRHLCRGASRNYQRTRACAQIVRA